MTTHDINNLIRALANDDTTALERLYTEMSKPVFFYALRICKNNEIAEDVMQETFLTAWDKANSFDAKNGRAWIFTIAKHKTMDKMRSGARQAALDETNVEETSSPLESALSDLAFWQMLSPLSDKERDVVSLRLLSGMALTEVAEELELPKGTVFWIYQNAIKKLRKKEGGERP